MALVGMALAELELLGFLKAERSHRPKKYLVTELGLAWVTTNGGDSPIVKNRKFDQSNYSFIPSSNRGSLVDAMKCM